jgi:4-carboxymuconolactone decarboxylase
MESFDKGVADIAATDPENGRLFIDELKKFSPDFAEYFVGFAFGKIRARPGLEAKVKELVSVASLIASGDCGPHLRLRIMSAKQAGCTKEQTIEVVIQSIVYVGFIRAIAALQLVREVWDEVTTEEPPADKK